MALNTCYQDTAPLVTSSVSDNRNYIGTESCFDAFSDKTADVRFPCERVEEKKVVTPEIHPSPILPSNVPSVLKREYTSDGRLLLKVEKIRGHEYLRAHRSNGRLILQLVSLDDDDDDDDDRDSDVKDD